LLAHLLSTQVELVSNASAQLLEAGATQERTLYAVACTPWFGSKP
jgi:hypothetical protein